MLLVMTLQQSLVVELLYTFCVLEEAIPRFSSYVYIWSADCYYIRYLLKLYKL